MANSPNASKRASKPETNTLKRARDGSAFAKCEECKKDVPVALIDMHSCSREAKIKMNLDAQVVENLIQVKKKPAERKIAKSADGNEKKTKKEQKEKDPNMPKRPLTAFFVFMDEFRKSYSEANPQARKGSAVAKEGGVKWKSLSDEEKKPYLDRAAELKAEYEKAMQSYDKNHVDPDEEHESSEKEGEELLNED